MAPDTVSRVASCVEYNETDGEEVASTRKQANVTAKRTTDNPDSTSPSLQKHQDLASDSGYSSRTRATSASADSGQSATAPAGATDMPGSSSQPQAKPAPSASSSHRSRSAKNCTDPHCAKCETARKKKATAASGKPQPPSDMPPPQTAKRASEKAAPSTAAAAAAAANAAPHPHPHPRPHPLRSTASTSRSRPRSVHGAYPDFASAAAYFPQPGYPYGHNGAAYMTGLGNIIAPERPGMPHRATDPAAAYSARRRPVSMVGTPMVSYDPAATHRLSARKPTKKPHEISVGFFGEDEGDEAEYEDEEDEKSTLLADERRKMSNEYHLMKAQLRALALKEENERQAQRSQSSLPAQPAASSGPKYSMRTYDKAATNITYGTRNDYDPDGIRNMPRGMNTNLQSGGSPWERRPSIPANLDHLRAYQQPAGNNPRVTINDPNWAPPRRMSYMGSENLEELRAKHRQIENLFANRLAEVPQSPTMHDRRASMNFHKRIDPELYNRLAELSPDDKPILESKLRDAMEYQREIDALRNRFGYVESTPLHGKGHRHHLDLPSEAERRSAPRSHASNDRIKPVPDRGSVSISGDEFKMLVDLTTGFEANFEGHRLAVNPTGEGSLAEVVFHGTRGNTSYHGTSKGSVTNEAPLGRGAREKAARPAERERERDRGRDRGRGRERERDRQRERRRERSHQHENEDDEQSSTSTSDFPATRPTRTKRADTYTSGRRAAEEQSETERPKQGHRRTKTSDARYAAGPSSPTRGRGKRTFLG